MPAITAIIVDDERMARENLQRLVEIHCPEVEVVGHCSNVTEAKVAILERDPYLLFLDIKMPGENGLEMLRKLPNRNFAVIFITAHAEYAVDAFAEEAVDYLLKPLHSQRLKDAVARVVRQQQAEKALHTKGELPHRNPSKASPKVSLPTSDGIELFDLHSIIRFQAKGSNTIAYMLDDQQLIIPRNLKKIEESLENGPFVRVHHSHLVNVDHIKRYSRTDGGFVIMKDGSEVEVSRRRKGVLLNVLASTL